MNHHQPNPNLALHIRAPHQWDSNPRNGIAPGTSKRKTQKLTTQSRPSGSKHHLWSRLTSETIPVPRAQTCNQLPHLAMPTEGSPMECRGSTRPPPPRFTVGILQKPFETGLRRKIRLQSLSHAPRPGRPDILRFTIGILVQKSLEMGLPSISKEKNKSTTVSRPSWAQNGERERDRVSESESSLERACRMARCR